MEAPVVWAMKIVEGQGAIPRRFGAFDHPLSSPTDAILIEIRRDVHATHAVVRCAPSLPQLLIIFSLYSSLALVLRLCQVPLQVYPALSRRLRPPGRLQSRQSHVFIHLRSRTTRRVSHCWQGRKQAVRRSWRMRGGEMVGVATMIW